MFSDNFISRVLTHFKHVSVTLIYKDLALDLDTGEEVDNGTQLTVEAVEFPSSNYYFKKFENCSVILGLDPNLEVPGTVMLRSREYEVKHIENLRDRAQIVGLTHATAASGV